MPRGLSAWDWQAYWRALVWQSLGIAAPYAREQGTRSSGSAAAAYQSQPNPEDTKRLVSRP